MEFLPDQFVGPLAGVGASLGWLFTSIFFTAAGRRVGATAVNTFRLPIAAALLALLYRFTSGDGSWLPEAQAGQLVLLGLSGLVGLAVGDQLLFTAFVDIGPRVTLLIMTTGSAIMAALLGVVVIGETMGVVEVVGAAVTLGGVAWVISERAHTAEDDRPHPHRKRGLILAFLAAGCQAGGALLSKQGMGHGWLPEEELMDPLPATLLRILFAMVFVIPIFLGYRFLRGRGSAALGSAERVGTKAGGALFIVLGAVVGPFFGVWMSLIAYDRASSLGVAQTLCSLSPVLILPFSVWLYRERVSPRAVLGALIAMAGTAALFLFS